MPTDARVTLRASPHSPPVLPRSLAGVGAPAVSGANFGWNGRWVCDCVLTLRRKLKK
jgi:hypothetical protein